MTRRYFAPELPDGGGPVTLSGEESQHAVRVMRVQIGEFLTIFDGKGREAGAKVIEVGRNACTVLVEEPAVVDRETARSIHLAVALPKPDRARELIERLTELGVQSVTPVVATRTQRPPSSSLIEKLRRGVVEACKQCGRNQLLDLRDPIPAKQYFSEPIEGASWIAHPEGEPISTLASSNEDVVTVAVGPEGGWTQEEVVWATNVGFQWLGLGKRIYRIETAATVIAAVLASE